MKDPLDCYHLLSGFESQQVVNIKCLLLPPLLHGDDDASNTYWYLKVIAKTVNSGCNRSRRNYGACYIIKIVTTIEIIINWSNVSFNNLSITNRAIPCISICIWQVIKAWPAKTCDHNRSRQALLLRKNICLIKKTCCVIDFINKNKHHLSRYLIPFFFCTSNINSMVQELDYKTRLVVEVFSISTRLVVCVHTYIHSSACDWTEKSFPEKP